MTKQLMSGRPLIEIAVPIIGYLGSEDAVAEHNARVDKDYQGLSILKPFTYNPEIKEVRGSNIPAVALFFQKTLRQEGYRLAELSDLESARVLNRNLSCGLDTKGYCYVDLGIVVRAETERTANLVQQIRKRNKNLAKLKSPVVILISGIEPVIGGSIDGLNYNLLDDAVMYSAPEYAGENKTFSNVVNKGRPVVSADGNRNIWNNSNLDLSRLYLNRNLDLDSNYGDLAYSNDYGRVVLVSGEATAQKKFAQDYKQRLQREVDSAKSELDKWLTASMARMPRGNK